MSDNEHSTDNTIPFYPDHIRTELYVALGILVVVLIIAIAGMIKPVGLGEPADPLNTPLHEAQSPIEMTHLGSGSWS
jgi:hypothetical protein